VPDGIAVMRIEPPCGPTLPGGPAALAFVVSGARRNVDTAHVRASTRAQTIFVAQRRKFNIRRQAAPSAPERLSAAGHLFAQTAQSFTCQKLWLAAGEIRLPEKHVSLSSFGQKARKATA